MDWVGCIRKESKDLLLDRIVQCLHLLNQSYTTVRQTSRVRGNIISLWPESVFHVDVTTFEQTHYCAGAILAVSTWLFGLKPQRFPVIAVKRSQDVAISCEPGLMLAPEELELGGR